MSDTKIKRCCADDCKKKLTLTDFNCRCGNRFCGAHRYPETHKCSFDYHAFAKTQLQTQLVKMDGQDARVDRI